MMATRDVVIVAPPECHPLEATAARVLRDCLVRRGVREVRIRAHGDAPPADGAVITLGSDGAPSAPESFRIRAAARESGRAQITIAGSDPNGTLYGVGRLLRLLRWTGDGFAVPETEVAESPRAMVRGWYLANHIQTTSYDKWELADWEDYIREAALWGVNTLVVYPMHASRWKGVDPWSEPPAWESEEVRREWQRQWAIQKVLPLVAKSYGMRFGIWNPVNDIFPLQHRRARQRTPGLCRNEDRDRGPLLCNRFDYLCPSVPEARRLINDVRRHVFEGLAHVDFMFLPSGDDGGCPCPDCAPWVKTYIGLIEEQSALLRQYHPNAELWVSNQKLPLDETGILLDYLTEPDKPDCLTTFCNGPFSGGKEFADQGLPHVAERLRGHCDVVLYPDTTHMSRCQFPIPDVDPEVLRVFRREDGPFARPNGYRQVHRENALYSVGSILYSEGCHDTMNKVMWAQWEWDPQKSAEAAVRDYCRWYFGPETLSETKRAVFLKEENWSRPLAGNAQVKEVVGLVESADRRMPPIYRDGNWRWLLVGIEAYLFHYLQYPADAVLRERILALRDEIYGLYKLDVRGCERI